MIVILIVENLENKEEKDQLIRNKKRKWSENSNDIYI